MNFAKPKKSLGQNFLTDQAVLGKIVKAANLSKDDKVLEIGPGRGVLTRELLEKTSLVFAVEKDEALVDHLNTSIQDDNFKVISGDILTVNLPRILKENNMLRYKLVANIPYYITGKLLRTFLEAPDKPELLILLLQKEVAERICAEPGRMNILAVSVQLFGWPEIIADVSKESFEPVPKVDSSILKIKPFSKERLCKKDAKEFFRLLKCGFASPRKTLLNNLASGLKFEKSDLLPAVEKTGFNEKTRAQELSVENWITLQELLFQK